jgi:hypothetical protein
MQRDNVSKLREIAVSAKQRSPNGPSELHIRVFSWVAICDTDSCNVTNPVQRDRMRFPSARRARAHWNISIETDHMFQTDTLEHLNVSKKLNSGTD